jgi:hypothetical protein
MKLVDLRGLSIREQLRIHFRLRSGMECIVTEHGIAQVPGIKGIPAFNLEDELAAAGEFLIEPVAGQDKKSAPKPRPASRDELAAMLPGAAAAAAAEHEDE